MGRSPTRNMLNIGPQELILVLIIALIVVGPQRLPELGRTIGKAIREFRKIQDDVKDTIKFDLNDEPEPHVRPRRGPNALTPEGSGEASTKGAPAPTDTPDTADADGSVLPEGVAHPDADVSTETGTDPEARAVE